MAPLRLRRGQGAMQRNPCCARLFADLPHTPQGAISCPFGTIHLVSPNPMKASGGRSRALPVADEARRKPSEQGSARKAPRADAARSLQTALRPPTPPEAFRQPGSVSHGRALLGYGVLVGRFSRPRPRGGRRARAARTKQGQSPRPFKHRRPPGRFRSPPLLAGCPPTPPPCFSTE